MTPKEKANEIAGLMFHEISDGTLDISQVEYISKQCALIAVDEILKSNPIIPLKFMTESESLDAACEYWQEVKQEIEKL